jgi:oligoribonuclease NrnB/cAMP/cGMP phosphodiesterase (DHH superfamily)
MKDKKYIFFHSDLDGIAGYIIAKFFDFAFDDYFVVDYFEIENDTFDYTQLDDCNELIFSDFSPSSQAFREYIEKNNIKTTIYDHHESAKEAIEAWTYTNKKFVYGGTEKSGTMLLYENEFKGSALDKAIVDDFTKLVDVYDNWKISDPLRSKAEDLNRLLYKTLSYGKKDKTKYDFFVKIMLDKLHTFDTFSFNNFEQSKINEDKKREENMFNDLVKEKIITRKDEKDRFFCLIECNSKISAMCARLLEKYKRVDYILCFNDYDKAAPKISLRSRKGINLLEYEGVKGHQESAGLECPSKEIWQDIKTGKVFSLTVKK